MNILQLSQTEYDGQREWVSVLHTGIDDTNISGLTDTLPPNNWTEEITKLMVHLSEQTNEREAILKKLINTVLRSFNPSNRADYLWYLKFTVYVLLLKDLPTCFYCLQGHLLTKCFSPSTAVWDSNPVKLDYFASQLYDQIENNKNLIFVTSQIENRSFCGFYISICMLWKAIYRCVGEEKPFFTLYPPSDLISITEKIRSKNLKDDFQTVLDFILLHSKIASLIFHRKLRLPTYKCYEPFFTYDVSLVKTIKDFLDDTLNECDKMWRRENDNLNYLMMIEYLQVDISEFDTLYKDVQK